MWPEELDLVDLTVRKFIQPKLMLDTELLRQRLKEVRAEKEALIEASGVTKADLMSNDKFAAVLIAAGVPASRMPKKFSPTTGLETYAFAKVDSALHRLYRDFPQVKTLVEARIATKSTIEETRLQRFLDVAEATGNILHVPLWYYGAHPGRFSGRDSLNLQNLGRGSVLRQALVAPPGCKIVAADLAQIEARLTATLAGQWDLVDQFARGEDVYANFASVIYGHKVTEETHPKERFVGKTAILSLGYQASGAKYTDTMNNVFKVPMTAYEGYSVVDAYRSKYKKIQRMWYDLNDLITKILKGERVRFGPVETLQDAVRLPNGMLLHYYKLRRGPDGYEYWNANKFTNLYGGKLTENLCQALARIVMTTAELRLARRGLQSVLSVHDELVYVVKEDHAETVAGVVERVMSHKVKWLPELPVKCKAKIGNNYGECK
jgi:DNA polymerase